MTSERGRTKNNGPSLTGDRPTSALVHLLTEIAITLGVAALMLLALMA